MGFGDNFAGAEARIWGVKYTPFSPLTIDLPLACRATFATRYSASMSISRKRTQAKLAPSGACDRNRSVTDHR